MKKFPKDLDIFLPSTCSISLCIQTRAKSASGWAHIDCAISFSWWGNCRSIPPPWMSKLSPRSSWLMAEHSMCQPGRPRPQGLSQPGRSSVEGFHRTKSIGSSLKGATSTLAPAIMSSTERPDSLPYP